ncbi:MAG TPA: acyl-CoA dehydrogenase family protein [Methylibium sp.]|nr:acyl-CoA dehydrogenase family protein [Methylibium sp.]
MSTSTAFEALLVACRAIAGDVAARHAADVDARARFPHETIAALREARVLSAGVPLEQGGAGCTLAEQALLCATVAQACGSSGMVLAMHYIQVGCIARHAGASAFFRGYLAELAEQQRLLASMTSEVGVYGDTRSSICSVVPTEDDRLRLDKDATTGSYCTEADAILVTCRRAPDAAAGDQVLVLVRREDCQLTQTTSWDTLGMRGTCSPGFRLASCVAAEQVLPGPFADSSAQTMVPYSHVLWSALWWGIAADAVARAAAFVRGQARQSPGTVPPTAQALARVSARLQAMRSLWVTMARDFDATCARADGRDELTTIGWALRLNNLKISASEAAPAIVHEALQIVGLLGYKNDSPHSLGRQYRDVLSASLMISNERIAARNAALLLVHKDA